MSALAWWRLTLALGALGLLVMFVDLRTHPIHAASPAPQATVPTKATSIPTAVRPPPPYTRTPISGGEWKDDFSPYSRQISMTDNINFSSSGQMLLAITDRLDWVQTWNAHFADGEFYHTEDLSDAVQISRDESTGQYYLFGTYTSAVFDAGRSVVWSYASWTHNGASPCSVVVGFRTGDVSTPDGTWSPWTISGCAYPPTSCYTYYGTSWCSSTFSPVPISRYYQYRATLINGDTSGTVALYDMSVIYGIYAPSGSALSYAIAPSDLRSWKQVFFSETVPAATSYSIDVLSPDGTVLLPNVSSGDSLESIDATRYRMVQLRATLRTDDPTRTPELDQWGLRWWMGWRFFFPSVQR
jgi:hypothetical protein